MKKVIFVDQATGYLSIDLINEFAKKYDKVILLAGSIRVQDIQLDENVEWIKIYKYNRGGFFLKALSWLVGTIQIVFQIIIRNSKWDVFYTTKPPYAYFLGLISSKKFAIQVLDVYPDVLKLYNVSERNIFYQIWSRLNKIIFKKAHRVYTISDRMMELLLQYADNKKVKVIPLWSGLTNVKPIKRNENKWAIDNGIENKFVVQYSGNVGYTHNVEVMLDVAKRLLKHEHIFFQIIGRGERFDVIKKQLDAENIKNCIALPFQPDEVLNQSLASAHLGVILLDEKIAHVSLPSKIYNLQIVGVPLLCFAPQDSELNYHVKKYNNGACFKESEIDAIADYILILSNDTNKYNQLSSNSLLAAKEFTTYNASKYIDDFMINN
jgi:glycosyltransferase involved in cell wall biosynthesis